MKTKLLILLAFLCAQSGFSFSNPTRPKTKYKAQTNFRNNCDPPISSKEMVVNTIRARLLSGGDMWWDGENAGLVIPNVKAGEKEVSAIYAAAVWMGGVDEGGNLKVAAQTYGRPNRNDYWSGPLRSSLDENPGTTDAEICRNWDQIFSVKRTEIAEHLDKYGQAAYNGTGYTIDQVPQSILGWPAKGNPFFGLVHGFDLPLTDIGLAGFWDEDGDGLYNPLKGDFPHLSLRACGKTSTPDEINFWIFNDNGNIHSESQGDPLQMEFQVEAFAYATDDQLNRTLFQKYKLVNRAIEPLDSTHFALWVDPKLGCHSDDFFGCDPDRSLVYIYNADAIDGQTDCECPGDYNTYCDEIPIIGIDLIKGPLGPKKIAPDGSLQNPALGEMADTIVELGMSSFTYYFAGGLYDGPPGTTSPGNSLEYYRYMTGSWRDGSPFLYGDWGYQWGTTEADYVFPDAPDDPQGWSMCRGYDEYPVSYGPGIDHRFIQSSGPFRLDPGAVNEILIGLTWVPDQEHPCPDISDIQAANDFIEKAVSNCFDSDYVPGPDAPDVDIVELDRELVLILSNDSVITSNNNAKELYQEIGVHHLCLDSTVTDSFYRFEGYKIFQLAGPDVVLIPENTENPDLARLVAQVDVKNGIGKIFNWKKIEPGDPFSGASYYTPVLMVDGQDEGIRHTFLITEDAFAKGDRRLINHKKYYYAAVAYAYNEFKPFDPLATVPGGQDKSYLEGRRNVGYNGKPYTAIPRPITDQMLNANFGEGAVITRLDGLGTGNNFLDISKETRQLIEEAFAVDEPFTGNLVYADGQGPIDVQVFNPLDIVDATFELKFVDDQQDDEVLQPGSHWELTHIENPVFRIVSEKSIEDFNEQLIRKYGFSITVGQVFETGSAEDQQNGFIGYDVEIGEEGENWLSFIPEGTDFSTLDTDDYLFDYLMTSPGQIDDDLDPNGSLSQFGQFAFMPYYLLGFEQREFGNDPPFLGPVHAQRSIGTINRLANLPEDLNNIDIVFTSNKDLWSRCVIVETANRFYEGLGVNTQAYTFGGEEVAATQFDLRPVLSVGKETDTNGVPIPDGAIDENGNPLYGLGWFPGYAIDVETGQRLNIFFGENSVYDGSTLTSSYTQAPTGGDMMFNPTNEVFLNGLGIDNLPLPYAMGGHHCVYVTKDPYDGCANYIEPLRRQSANDNELRKLKVLSQISWAGLLLAESGVAMLSYDEGLIPTEIRVKLRVNNPYQVETDNDDIDGDQRTGTGENNYHPKYQFSFKTKAPVLIKESAPNEILDAINIVPNPYYAFSDYETSVAEGIVKITNLPNKCSVTIYSLDGRFVRQYNRNEGLNLQSAYSEVLRYKQGNPDLEWDLKNANGIAIGPGVYLIHVKVDGIGERTLKWFGVGRKKKDF